MYRRYAGLYFCVCVDNNDNNLAYLECIHNLVEILDKYFANVCELDLVFNFWKVCIDWDIEPVVCLCRRVPTVDCLLPLCPAGCRTGTPPLAERSLSVPHLKPAFRFAWSLGILLGTALPTLTLTHPFTPAAAAAVRVVQVYTIVDEVFLAGEIMETSQNKVLSRMRQLEVME